MYKINPDSETEKYNKERTRRHAVYGGILGGILLLLISITYHILFLTDSDFFGLTILRETPIQVFFIGLLILSPIYLLIGISSIQVRQEKIKIKKPKEPFVLKVETDIDIKKAILVYLTCAICIIIGYFFIIFPDNIINNIFGIIIIILCAVDMIVYTLKYLISK